MSQMPLPRENDDEARRAAARRAFIRSSHPDVGGDPTAFIEGLARFNEPVGRRAHEASRPAVHRSRRADRIVKQTVRELRRKLSGLPPRRLK